MFFGTEGAGLSEDTLSQVDLRLQIGMETGVDSLNVATASGIALHRFRRGPWAMKPILILKTGDTLP